MKKIILLSALLSLIMMGCGSGGETSGSLSLTSPTYSNGVVSAVATYSPSSGSALPNQEIVFYWRTVGQVSNEVIDYPAKVSKTDSAGMAPSDLTLPSPRTENLIVYVKVGTGDLKTSLQSVEALQ